MQGLVVVFFLSAAGRAPALAASSCSADYWVSPSGDDLAKGNRSHPFRTLGRARDAVRGDSRRGRCPINVHLRGGPYRLASPLLLDARDSGAPGREVSWIAAPGETPVLSGAVAVEGWSPEDSSRETWRAWVGPRRSRQLFVDGQRAVRARTESFPPDWARTTAGYRFVTPGRPLPDWSNPSAVEAVTVTQWKMMRCPVASLRGADVEMRDPCWHNANAFEGVDGATALWNFRLLAWFENAREFLDEPGEWYLDERSGWLSYRPRPGEDLAKVSVELPVLEVLLEGAGTPERPLTDVRFSGLTFRHATWLGPSEPQGYAADQSGFFLAGGLHPPNTIGHDEHVTRTPGNVRFRYVRNVTISGNVFEQLGGVALDFDTGSQHGAVVDNVFEDLSSAAIQLGGVTLVDHHPELAAQVTRDNRVSNNLVRRTGREFWDTAAIYVGFTARSTVSHNDIEDVPWSGIAIGWGWGLLDEGSFAGVPGGTPGMWGWWTTPSTSRGNRIVHNRISNFLNKLWDGGAIYSQGAQGTSLEDGELIAWNVATGKRPAAGGNVIYTDGGSRYVTVRGNVSWDNPPGVTDFGPCGLPSARPFCWLGASPPEPGAPEPCSSLATCWLAIPYGADHGGCIAHGDLLFAGNYWLSNVYSTVCNTDLTVNVRHFDNRLIRGLWEVPDWILREAGRQGPGRSGSGGMGADRGYSPLQETSASR